MKVLTTEIIDALKGMTREQIVALKEAAERELETCILCGNIGATRWRFRAAGRGDGRQVQLMLCKPCIEKNRV